MRKRKSVLAAVLCAGLLSPAVATAAPSPAAVQATLLDSLSRQEVVDYFVERGIDPADVRNGVDLYALRYRTTGVDGRPTTASALTVLPHTRERSLRTVTWLHGTLVYRGDAPSRNDNLDRAVAVLFAASGDAVVAPDYLGLGTGPGTHPYMLSRPTVTATVDAMRASRVLAARNGTRLDGKVLVSGFSQGGQASMLVGRALQSSREFDLGGIAAIAGPYDIRGQELPAALDGRLDSVSATFYLGYAITAWNRVHRLYDSPSAAFRAPYDQVVESLFDGNHQEEDVIRALPSTPQELFTDEFLALLARPTGALADLLAEIDDPCQWRPRVPVRLYAGRADRDVVFANAESCETDLRAHGTRDVRLVDFGETDHVGSVIAALPEITRDW